MTLQEIIKQKIEQEKQKFTYTNNCENCAFTQKNSGKFCSRDCYYKTRFDYKSSFANNAPILAVKYFNISDNKKDEFIQFASELMDLYY